MKADLYARYSALIGNVTSVDHRVRQGLEQYKAKL